VGDGGRVLGRKVLHEQGGARRFAGRGRVRRHDQHSLEQGLEKVLERARVGCRGSELGPECRWREVGIRLVVTPRVLIRVVPRLSVVVGIPVPHGRFVEGGLLRGGVRPTEPRQKRDRLCDDHEQRQGVRDSRPQPSGT